MAKQESSQLRSICERLATARKSAMLAIILPTEPILPQHALEVQKTVGDSKCSKLDIVLHSGGGDINASYQIIQLLRRHCNDLTTIVPLYAKSAASLFVFGSNTIVMGELAELGPLDTQVAEREKGSRRYASALNPFKTLEELQRFALETLDVTVKLQLTSSDLSIDEAVKNAMDFASRVSSPLFAQLNAEKVGEYSRALEVGKEYGERLLRRYTKWQDEKERDEILEKIVRGYPSHDYIIDYEELKELGFDVRLPSEEEKPILDEMVRIILESQNPEIFFVKNEAKPSKKNNSNNRGGKGVK